MGVAANLGDLTVAEAKGHIVVEGALCSFSFSSIRKHRLVGGNVWENFIKFRGTTHSMAASDLESLIGGDHNSDHGDLDMFPDLLLFNDLLAQISNDPYDDPTPILCDMLLVCRIDSTKKPTWVNNYFMHVERVSVAGQELWTSTGHWCMIPVPESHPGPIFKAIRFERRQIILV
jgi:hypothetical protein